MLGFNDDDSTKRIEGLLKALTDLFSQVFLNLQTMREDVNHTWYLAETNDITIRYICHVHLSEEGQDVMFAELIEFNTFHHHHLVVILLEHR